MKLEDGPRKILKLRPAKDQIESVSLGDVLQRKADIAKLNQVRMAMNKLDDLFSGVLSNHRDDFLPEYKHLAKEHARLMAVLQPFLESDASGGD